MMLDQQLKRRLLSALIQVVIIVMRLLLDR